MRISQELYNSGVLGHFETRARGSLEFFDPGVPRFRRTGDVSQSRSPGALRSLWLFFWRVFLNVIHRH